MRVYRFFPRLSEHTVIILSLQTCHTNNQILKRQCGKKQDFSSDSCTLVWSVRIFGDPMKIETELIKTSQKYTMSEQDRGHRRFIVYCGCLLGNQSKKKQVLCICNWRQTGFKKYHNSTIFIGMLKPTATRHFCRVLATLSCIKIANCNKRKGRVSRHMWKGSCWLTN
jgi:hypothetical protein